jgi:hypothetical protein
MEKLLMMVAIQKAGYPLSADDLTIDEWLDIARVKTAIEQKTAGAP